MVKAGRYLWKSSALNPLLKWGDLEPVAQDMSRWLLNISKGGNSMPGVPGNLQHLFVERNGYKERLCFFLIGLEKVCLASVNHWLLLSLFFFMFN